MAGRFSGLRREVRGQKLETRLGQKKREYGRGLVDYLEIRGNVGFRSEENGVGMYGLGTMDSDLGIVVFGWRLKGKAGTV